MSIKIKLFAAIKAAAEVLVGVSAGAAASAGVFALITVIGILPRWAGHTRTARHVSLYEWSVILGGTAGNLIFLLQPSLPGKEILEAAAGLFMGIFVGGLIMSLAEVLDVFPILLMRGRIQSGIPWMVLSIGIGKMLGAYLYFSKKKKKKEKIW